jgi:hypothetical protein
VALTPEVLPIFCAAPLSLGTILFTGTALWNERNATQRAIWEHNETRRVLATSTLFNFNSRA